MVWWGNNLPVIKENCKTELQCAKSKIPSITRLRKDFGDKQVARLLALEILALNKIVNVDNIMDKEQIRFTIDSIFEEYGQLNLADINLIMTRGKRGYYGKFYNRITCADIMDMFRKHFAERINQSEEDSYNQAMNYKEPNVHVDFVGMARMIAKNHTL